MKEKRKAYEKKARCAVRGKEGAYITLEMLWLYLEEVVPEQEFSIRTLGRTLDRWGFTFGKGVRTQRFKEKDHVVVVRADSQNDGWIVKLY